MDRYIKRIITENAVKNNPDIGWWNNHWMALLYTVIFTSTGTIYSIRYHDWVMGGATLISAIVFFLLSEVGLYYTAGRNHAASSRKRTSAVLTICSTVAFTAYLAGLWWMCLH